MIRRRLLLCSSLAVALFSGLASADEDLDRRVREVLDVRTFDYLDLTVTPAEAGGSFQLEGLRFADRDYSATLHPHSVRSDQFRLLVQEENGSIVERVPQAPSTYRGQVDELPKSVIAASIRDGRVSATVLLEDGTSWSIQPLSDVEPSSPSWVHVIYDGLSLDLDPHRCGLDDLPLHAPGSSDLYDGGGIAPQGPTAKLCEIAYDADVEFYNQNGSSVSNTRADIEDINNGMSAIYERDTDIVFEITTILVRTSEPDPYSTRDPAGLLGQFQAEWVSNQSGVHRDIAHLMTGKNLSGSTIGIAFLAVICSQGAGYGLSQSRFTSNRAARIALTAHELGHNWAANHCSGNDCRIMCPGLGGCTGDISKFGASSIATITNYRDTRPCLSLPGTPISLPFVETFPSPTFDDTLWSEHQNIAINTNAQNEPSAPYSVNIDATNGGVGDDLRTQPLLLGSVPLAVATFHTQHRGVESGESLIIEYLDEALEWHEMGRITSDGVDQSDFVAHSIYLPGNAYHDNACLRFRTDANQANDEFYIDDIRIDEVDCLPPQHYGTSTPGGFDIVPIIDYSGGLPFIGNTEFKLEGSAMHGQAMGFLFTGFSRQTVELGDGVWLNVLPPWFIVPFTTNGLPLPGYGSITIPAPIPDDSSLEGVHFMNFMLVNDPGGPMGYQGTDGLDSTICR